MGKNINRATWLAHYRALRSCDTIFPGSLYKTHKVKGEVEGNYTTLLSSGIFNKELLDMAWNLRHDNIDWLAVYERNGQSGQSLLRFL